MAVYDLAVHGMHPKIPAGLAGIRMLIHALCFMKACPHLLFHPLQAAVISLVGKMQALTGFLI